MQHTFIGRWYTASMPHPLRRMAVPVLATAMLAVAGIACDRETPDPPPPAPPTPSPVPPPTPVEQTRPLPATQPAVEPGPAHFVINGQQPPFIFPPAKLVLEPADGKVRAMLFSIDPPEAVKARDLGNSFYFDLDLDMATLDELSGQRVEYQNSSGNSRDRDDDATTGIFIAGGRQVLQPLRAAIDFHVTESGQAVVAINGMFELRDEQSPDSLPAEVPVRARLLPLVKEQTR